MVKRVKTYSGIAVRYNALDSFGVIVDPQAFDDISKKIKEIEMAGFRKGSLGWFYRQPGVVDITPRTARGYFAKALRAESQGDDEEAVKALDLAIFEIDYWSDEVDDE